MSTGRLLKSSIRAQIQSAECFGAFIHVSEMTNNEAIARSIPTLSLQLDRRPPEELPECALLLQHVLEKYFGWSKQLEATCWSFGVQYKSFSSKFLIPL